MRPNPPERRDVLRALAGASLSPPVWAQAPRPTAPVPVDTGTLEQLLHGRHYDPHSVLGPHVGSDGVTIRVLRPWARAVTVLVGGFVFALPVGTLIVFFVLAAVAGVVAAIPPARRASKVDVLRAVTTE